MPRLRKHKSSVAALHALHRTLFKVAITGISLTRMAFSGKLPGTLDLPLVRPAT